MEKYSVFVIEESYDSHIVSDVLDHNYTVDKVAGDEEVIANREVITDGDVTGDEVVTADEEEEQHMQNTVSVATTTMKTHDRNYIARESPKRTND